jgi:hypothetical protein
MTAAEKAARRIKHTIPGHDNIVDEQLIAIWATSIREEMYEPDSMAELQMYDDAVKRSSGEKKGEGR